MPSTVIRSFTYDMDQRRLDLLFTTGRIYSYRDAFRAAFSKGRHFNAHIRDAYDYAERTADSVPSAKMVKR